MTPADAGRRPAARKTGDPSVDLLDAILGAADPTPDEYDDWTAEPELGDPRAPAGGRGAWTEPSGRQQRQRQPAPPQPGRRPRQSRLTRRPPRPSPRPSSRWPQVRRTLGVVALAFLTWLGYSVGTALVAPGTASSAARIAEWARDHHLNVAINFGERVQYWLHPPRTGGTPAGGLPVAQGPDTNPTPTPSAGAIAVKPPELPHTPAPLPIQPFAQPALVTDGYIEGHWQTLRTVKGLPAVRAAYLRPDSVHTSYLAGVAWMDPKLVSFQLHPGTAEPGGSGWSLPSSITPNERTSSLLAAFNSGFRLQDSRGGYYAEGRTVRPLRAGAASFVIYRDGTVAIGEWGRDVGMTAQVSVVRQNLDLLVDGGQVSPAADQNNTPKWGYTLGNVEYVWRSGVGITADGAIVYVAGNALSVRTLGNLLAAAGAVRGMEFDINPEWTTYYYYAPDGSSPATPHKLTPDENKPESRYFNVSERDFFVVRAR